LSFFFFDDNANAHIQDAVEMLTNKFEGLDKSNPTKITSVINNLFFILPPLSFPIMACCVFNKPNFCMPCSIKDQKMMFESRYLYVSLWNLVQTASSSEFVKRRRYLETPSENVLGHTFH
jgi:hypothetical protein